MVCKECEMNKNRAILFSKELEKVNTYRDITMRMAKLLNDDSRDGAKKVLWDYTLFVCGGKK